MTSVRDGEKEKVHVRIPVANVSAVEGIVTISLMTGQSKSKGYGTNMWENVNAVRIPAKTASDIGILLDSRPVMLTLDTNISRNIPASMNIPLWQQKMAAGETIF